MANPAPGYAKKPEHRVDLLPETRRVRVVFNGTMIADSTAALRVEETGHEPVHYIPEKDVRLDLMRPTDHKSYCPFKGDCSYWTIAVEGPEGKKEAVNAVWGYRAPYDEATRMAGHYAFYKTRVDAIEVQ
jgi:uncharacterized protein (DUF427 family)